MKPRVDPDSWAVERREELFALFQKTGQIPSGAMLLVERHPETREELPAPEVLEQTVSDYPDYRDFVQALHVHSMRLGGVAAVMYGEAMLHPEETTSGAPEPVVFITYARRGYLHSVLWTARIRSGEFGRVLENVSEHRRPVADQNRIFQVMN